MITEENVNKVALLAYLEISQEERKKYAKELGDILTEIEKIQSCQVENTAILIAPTNEIKINNFASTKTDNNLSKDEIMKNAKKHNQSYIIVKRVVNE